MARPLHNIADEIIKDWPNPYFGAIPYISAMRHLETMDDRYGEDSAKNVVVYLLSNAATWRGDTARRVKAELKAMVK